MQSDGHPSARHLRRRATVSLRVQVPCRWMRRPCSRLRTATSVEAVYPARRLPWRGLAATAVPDRTRFNARAALSAAARFAGARIGIRLSLRRLRRTGHARGGWEYTRLCHAPCLFHANVVGDSDGGVTLFAEYRDEFSTPPLHSVVKGGGWKKAVFGKGFLWFVGAFSLSCVFRGFGSAGPRGSRGCPVRWRVFVRFRFVWVRAVAWPIGRVAVSFGGVVVCRWWSLVS